MLTGCVCKYRDFAEPWFKTWAERIKNPKIHRKAWEWVAIAQALGERDMLREGRRGIGFAVGKEPLASLFASCGAMVDATDIGSGDVAEEWSVSNQHADSIDPLFYANVVDRGQFDQNVRFFHADMNRLDALPSDTYDFMWSSCAMEHLGSLDHGLNFVVNAMRLLKPGGVAAHTTEFNVADLDATLAEGIAVIYRECDLRKLDGMLRKRFCYMEPMDFDRGQDPEDILYDTPPWEQGGRLHIKLLLDGFICTSALLICRRVA
jgi:SAM-dependent methyltransferase